MGAHLEIIGACQEIIGDSRELSCRRCYFSQRVERSLRDFYHVLIYLLTWLDFLEASSEDSLRISSRANLSTDLA